MSTFFDLIELLLEISSPALENTRSAVTDAPGTLKISSLTYLGNIRLQGDYSTIPEGLLYE